MIQHEVDCTACSVMLGMENRKFSDEKISVFLYEIIFTKELLRVL